eukprot:751655-Hanusia_phi.AAC.1
MTSILNKQHQSSLVIPSDKSALRARPRTCSRVSSPISGGTDESLLPHRSRASKFVACQQVRGGNNSVRHAL